MYERIEYQALKSLGASEQALRVYQNTDPCTIIWDNSLDVYIVDIAGDKRTCQSPEEMIAFLESYGEEDLA